MSTPDEHEPTPLELAWLQHVSTDIEFYNRVVTRHRERQRRYHTMAHVEAVLDHVVTLTATEAVSDLGVVVTSAFYHDAVYEPMHPANERASARLARRDLSRLGWSEDRTDMVADMIEGTATHRDPANNDAAVLFDADLAILAAPEATYLEYVSKTHAEYRHLDDKEWAEGRATVLQSFLDRDSIYATATGRDMWEAPARTNIAAELDALSAHHD